MTKLDEAKITVQGQISIPKRVRERLHVKKGDKIVFLEDSQGRIFIQEVEAEIEFTSQKWSEFLAKTQKESVTKVRGKEATLKHLDKLSEK